MKEGGSPPWETGPGRKAGSRPGGLCRAPPAGLTQRGSGDCIPYRYSGWEAQDWVQQDIGSGSVGTLRGRGHTQGAWAHSGSLGTLRERGHTQGTRAHSGSLGTFRGRGHTQGTRANSGSVGTLRGQCLGRGLQKEHPPAMASLPEKLSSGPGTQLCRSSD